MSCAGAQSIKQPDIIHTSLLRVLSPINPDEYTRKAIQRVCDKWTHKLRGTEWTAAHVWLVYETHFSTIKGTWHEMELSGKS